MQKASTNEFNKQEILSKLIVGLILVKKKLNEETIIYIGNRYRENRGSG